MFLSPLPLAKKINNLKKKKKESKKSACKWTHAVQTSVVLRVNYIHFSVLPVLVEGKCPVVLASGALILSTGLSKCG